MLADSSKWITAITETDFSATMHFSLGMWMRNNRKLWKDSRLSKYFNQKGIHHPDDMSAIITASYYLHLKGQDIKLAEQIKYYQKYWEEVEQLQSGQDRKVFCSLRYRRHDSFQFQSSPCIKDMRKIRQ